MAVRRVVDLYKQAFSGIGRDAWLLSLIALINRAGTMVFPFLTLYLTKQEHFTTGQASMLLLVFGAGSLTGSYLGGLASTRWGSLSVLTFSLLTSGIFFMVFPIFHGFYVLLVACYIMGVTADAFRPAVMSAIALYSRPESQARAFALLRLACNLGMGIGPAVGGFLAARDYSLIFRVDGLTCMFAGLLVPFLFKARLSAAAKRKERDESRERPKVQPLRDTPFMFLMLMVFGFAFVIFQFMGAYPLFLNQHYGLPEQNIGLLFGMNALILTLFEMVAVHKLETSNPLTLFGVGTFLACIGFAMLPLGTHFGFALICITVFTMGEMLSLPFSNTLVALRAGKNSGAYMGVYSAVFSLAIMIGPPLGLYFMEAWGPKLFWFSQGLLGLLVWIGSMFLNRISDFAHPKKQVEGNEPEVV